MPGKCLEKGVAYADDLLIFCTSKAQLRKVIKLINEWCNRNNLKINLSKSAIIEFMPRRSYPGDAMRIGSVFEGFPVVNSYRYLGILLTPRLSLKDHCDWAARKMDFIYAKLAPVIFKVTPKYRYNLWSTFIKPVLEPIAMLSFMESTATGKETCDGLYRKSIKLFLGLLKNVQNNIVEHLVEYNIQERGEDLTLRARQAWQCRSQFLPVTQRKLRTFINNLDWVPRNLIKLVNITAGVCPDCSMTQRSADHLNRRHNLPVADPINLIDRILEENGSRRKVNNPNHQRQYQELNEEAKVYIDEVSRFLNNT